MITSVIALFIVTALAVSIRNAPRLRLFLTVFACVLFVLSLALWWSEHGRPDITSLEFLKAFGGLVVLTLFGAGAGAGASGRQGK